MPNVHQLRAVALDAGLDALALTQAARIGQHPPGPAVDVVLAHGHAQARHALALLGRRHLQRLLDGVGALLDVVRIDDQGLGEFARRPGEAAQDEHPLLVVARRHEFLADEVHAVVQAGDEADVGGAVELVEGVVLVVPGQQDHGVVAG